MVTETTNFDRLLPTRHPQPDFFICDVADAILKDVMAHMEHPFYSLSKKPETRVRRYEHNGNWIEITPSVKGQATIYDKDILIYCISQIMAKLKNDEPVTPRVRIQSRELLIFTNRGTSGRDYMALTEAIDRLAGTRISTNIKTGDEEQYDNFGLIDAASIRRKNGLDGRLLWCEVKLSDWVFNAIRSNEVLTLHHDYFRLRKPLERRVYELARKHCGHQPEWKISLEKLLKKSGSQSPMKRFKQMIKGLADTDYMPDYIFQLDGDMLTVQPKPSFQALNAPENEELFSYGLVLRYDTYDKAREVAPGWDIYALEDEWRAWIARKVTSGEKPPTAPDSSFLGFCRQRGPCR